MMENALRKKNVRVSIKITGTTQVGFLLASERAPPRDGKIENSVKGIGFLLNATNVFVKMAHGYARTISALESAPLLGPILWLLLTKWYIISMQTVPNIL